MINAANWLCYRPHQPLSSGGQGASRPHHSPRTKIHPNPIHPTPKIQTIPRPNHTPKNKNHPPIPAKLSRYPRQPPVRSKTDVPQKPPSPQIPNPPPPKQTAGLKHPPKGTSTPPLADIIALEALEQSPQSELMIPHPLIQPFLLPSARSPHPAGSTPRGSAKRQRR